MCHNKSGEAVYYNDAEVSLKTLLGNDSHTEIRKVHNIREAQDGVSERHTPLEYMPLRAKRLGDFAGYELVFDADRPAWWTESHTASAIAQFQAVILGELANGMRDYLSAAYLSGCTGLTTVELPAATTVHLRGCTGLTAATKDALRKQPNCHVCD